MANAITDKEIAELSDRFPLIIGRCVKCGADVYDDEEYGHEFDGDFLHDDCQEVPI